MTAGTVKSFVLLTWAAFFVWLLVSGEVYRYIGPRTYWVVIFGAICLSAIAVANVFLVMRHDRVRPGSRQLLGFLAALVPILLVLLIPKPTLGSLAASRKASGGVVSAAVQPSLADPSGDVGFKEIGYASESLEYAGALGLTDGYPVELTGFVSDVKTGIPDGAFPLTRFSIFCCAADSVPYSVPVKAPEDGTTYTRDTWLNVEGALFLDGTTWVLEADSIEEVSEPLNPYI